MDDVCEAVLALVEVERQILKVIREEDKRAAQACFERILAMVPLETKRTRPDVHAEEWEHA